MAQFKGTVFLATRSFTESRFGLEAVEQVLGTLPASDREVLRHVSPVAWCPIEPVLAYHYALDRMYGKDDLELCEEVGHFSAGWSMNSVLKFFVKFRNPHWLTDRAASVWNRYHDSGTWQYDPPQSKQMRGRLLDFKVCDPAFCTRLRGWLRGAIELTGGQSPQVTERVCATRGHAHHEFLCTWE